MRAQVVSLVLLFVALNAQVGCGGAAGPSCGAGTTLIDGACVAEATGPNCGTGTVQIGTVCVPVVEDVAVDVDTGPDVAPDVVPDAEVDVVPDASDVTVVTPDVCTPTCASTETCVAGVCEPLPVPAAWNCAKTVFADGQTCDCGCGAVDPDCLDAAKPVVGCKTAGACQPSGACPVCTPSCVGKVCGDDGCGGLCGVCVDPAKPSCVGGACSACVPQCSNSTCGDDGCGGSCGTCAEGQLCTAGKCAYPTADESCTGHCGGFAPSGCACTPGCAADGTCCVDVGACGCMPDCSGKSCGDDGCGGSCGSCGLGTICATGQCKIIGLCDDALCNGHGKCNVAGDACVCQPTFVGAFCDACAADLIGYPSCVPPCTDVTQCDDASACTLDLCSPVSGCLHIAISCDDGNLCTSDACAPATGCSYTPSAAASCEDDDACTGTGSCSGSTCVGGSAVNCDDGNACSLDSCAAKVGCVHTNTDAPCDDGDACSSVSACVNLACTSLGGVNCDDGNPCTQDLCDSQTAQCSHPASVAGTPCDDDDGCTTSDTCDGLGGCTSGTKVCALTVTSGIVAHFSAAQLNSLAFGEDKMVQTWQDQSGQGHDLAAWDAANAPILTSQAIHGRRGVRMTGAAGLQSQAFGYPSAVSVFAVLCTESTGFLNLVAAQGIASGWQIGGTANSVSLATDNSGLEASIQPGGCRVIAARVGGGKADLLSIDAVSTGDTNSATLAPGTEPLRVGTNGGAFLLGELLIYDHALTDAERDSVATYLRAAWGFAPPPPDLAWFDASDAATVQRDAQNLVTAWLDKSGLAHDALVGDAESPQWFAAGTSNGLPAVRFDGGAVRLQTAALKMSANVTVFTVFELDQPQPWGTVLTHAVADSFALRKTDAVASTVQWQTAANPAPPELPFATGQWQVLTALQDGTLSAIYTDAADMKTAVGPALTGLTGALSLGNSPTGGASMGGFVAEILAYSSALMPTDRAFVEHILHVKYGL